MNPTKFLGFVEALKSKETELVLEAIKSGFMAIFMESEAAQKVSLQDAKDAGMFGPVYHGTDEASREKISQEGFKVFVGDAKSGEVKHGYDGDRDYTGSGEGIPAPVHHLGYGVYLTTNKSIAKGYNGGGGKGLKTYFINSKKILTINFGAPNTMMKWWIANGYDPKLAKTDRVAATQKLTEYLSSLYDAVYFKGKGLRKLLDGDQICVFRPELIVEVEASLSKPGDSGAKVKRKADGMIGIIKDKRDAKKMYADLPGSRTWLKPETSWLMSVTWKKGGTDMNVQDVDVEFV